MGLYLGKVFKYIKQHWIVSIIIAMLIVFFGRYYFQSGNVAPSIVVAARTNVTQEVSITGNVKPAESVDLAFEKSGTVKKVNVRVGDKVLAGETVAELENSDLMAQINQAEANVASQVAKLSELKAGMRPEQLQIDQARLDNAQTALAISIQDAYAKSYDAIMNKSDKLFYAPRLDPQINIFTGSTQLKIDINRDRLLIENMFVNWASSVSQLTPQNAGILSGVADANTQFIKLFLDKIALMLNDLSSGSSMTQTQIEGYKADISGARSSVYGAISSLKSAKASLDVAQKQLDFDLAGATPADLAVQEAQLYKARADADNYRVQLDRTILKSPIDGTVAKQDAKIGQIAAANVTVVSVISGSAMEIDAYVPEADIAKLKVGNSANVTLDAYGSDVVFAAKVAIIDPAETVIEGVANYKTTILFVNDDERLKSGMTANVDILADRRENVIAIPQRVIVMKEDGNKYILLWEGRSSKEVSVQVGLRGSDGNTEIVSGVNEGDKIAVPQ